MSHSRLKPDRLLFIMPNVSPIHAELKSLLHAKSMRATASRMTALKVLHDAARPLSHAELMSVIDKDGWDPATMYRVLSDLTEANLLCRMDLGDHIWRFELRDACRSIQDEHAHFLCTDCGQVTCLPEVELRTTNGSSLPASMIGAELHLRVTGRCSGCLSA